MRHDDRPLLETLLSYKKVAEILDVDIQTVRRQVTRGEITPIKIGKSVKFEPKEVADFIERCRQSN
jgi:excisionase family DNA binding protein